MPNKPVPTGLKILRGNPGKRPLNKREPKPPLGCEFPTWLDALGDPSIKAIWDELSELLTRSHVVTVSDGEALSMLAHKIWMYRTAAMELKDGTSYECVTESGAALQRTKPEVALLSDLGKQIRGLLSDFGMTPSSRTKVSTTGEDNPTDCIEDFLCGGKL